MRHHEGRLDERRVHALHAKARWWIARVSIMVAPDEYEPDALIRFMPPLQRRESLRGTALSRMQEVAEEHDARGAGLPDERIESCQPFHRGAARYRNRHRAEGCCLAEVRVRDEQGLPPLPEDCAVRQQRQPLAAHLDRQAHPAARSRTICMRRMRSPMDSEDTRFRVRSTSKGKARGGVRFGVVMITFARESRSSVRPSRLDSSCRSSTSR